jgi:hypothetical protein
MQACEPIQTNPADATETAVSSSTGPTTEWVFDPHTTHLIISVNHQPNSVAKIIFLAVLK